MRYLRTAFVLSMLFIAVPGQRLAARSQALPKLLARSTRVRRAEPSLPMKSMLFAFKLQNESELNQLLEAQQNPDSPSYHKWLTPEEFGNRFGISEQTYERAVQWLEHQGFSNIQRSPNRLSIYFDGYASLVEQAFDVQMDIYEYEGKQYHSNDREAQIPSEYRDVILGLFLDDFPTVAPLYRSGGNTSMSPPDMRIAYNLTPVYNRGVTGSGQNIAIVARSDFNLSDVELFRSTFGLAANDPHKVFVGANPGNLGKDEETEVLLDTEWAGAIAPNAAIQVVISPTTDITQSINYIVNSLPSTHVMSISFGEGESAESLNFRSFRLLSGSPLYVVVGASWPRSSSFPGKIMKPKPWGTTADGLMENAAAMEIHKKRGFPQLLGEVPQKAAGLPHISHRPYRWALFRQCAFLQSRPQHVGVTHTKPGSAQFHKLCQWPFLPGCYTGTDGARCFRGPRGAAACGQRID